MQESVKRYSKILCCVQYVGGAGAGDDMLVGLEADVCAHDFAFII